MAAASTAAASASATLTRLAAARSSPCLRTSEGAKPGGPTRRRTRRGYGHHQLRRPHWRCLLPSPSHRPTRTSAALPRMQRCSPQRRAPWRRARRLRFAASASAGRALAARQHRVLEVNCGTRRGACESGGGDLTFYCEILLHRFTFDPKRLVVPSTRTAVQSFFIPPPRGTAASRLHPHSERSWYWAAKMIAVVCLAGPSLITCLHSRDFKDTHRESVAVASIDSLDGRSSDGWC